MRNAQTYESLGNVWLTTLNGKASNTQRIYAASFERTRVFFGRMTPPITNRSLKEYVSSVSHLSASTIRLDLLVIKQVVESLENDDLEPLFPLTIKYKKIGLDDAGESDGPCATLDEVLRGIADPEVGPLIFVASSLGLRISEILALRFRGPVDADVFDPDARVVHIRKTLKTPSSRRSIPLIEVVNEQMLQYSAQCAPGALLFRAKRATIYHKLKALNLAGMHSFRKFFATAHDRAGMNPSALVRIMGHSSKPMGLTFSVYSKAGDDEKFLRSEMEKCGLGFELPELIPS